MAVPEVSEKTREKMKNNDKKRKFLLEQEIKLVKGLAGNNKQIRDKALKGLRKWFQNPATNFGEEDFMRIWQGLFYTLWMSDKPLIQEEYAENIAQLVHFSKTESALLFFKCGVNTLMNKWSGIDQHRLDKFLMFVRRFLRQIFIYLKKHSYSLIEDFNKILDETVLEPKKTVSLGFYMHFCEVFLEELAKVWDANNEKIVELFLGPFIKHLIVLQDKRQINHVVRHIFRHLFRQSDLGIEYHEKFRVWQKIGFPGKSVHDLVKEEVSDDEEEENSDSGENKKNFKTDLDARAGHVSVVLPQLQFDALKIVQMLEKVKFAQGSNTNSRKAVKKLISEFNLMAKGIYPLGMKPSNVDEKPAEVPEKINISKSNKTKEKLQKAKRKKRLNEETIDDQLNGFHEEKEEEEENKSVVKRKRKLSDSENFCGTFRRNSGIWFVFEINDNEGSKKTEESPVVINNNKQKKRKNTKTNEVSDDISLSQEPPKKKLKKVPVSGGSKISPKQTTPKSLIKSALSSTPNSSTKKVNINLKMNQSQEIHEHLIQVKKSPQVPWDANKKPKKPLLKPFVLSPINPFYKRKFNL